MGAPRLAILEPRESDWVDLDILRSQQAGLDDLPDASQRELVSAGWIALGSRIHRAVVDASRFTLELMAVGAPPELLERAEACGSELTEVAAVALAVASAYSGARLAPGGLEAPEPLRVEPSALAAGIFHQEFFGGEVALSVHDMWRKADLRPEIARAAALIGDAARNQCELARDSLCWLLRGPGASAIPVLDAAMITEISWDGLALLPCVDGDLERASARGELESRGLLAPAQLAELGRRSLGEQLPRLRSELLSRVMH